MGTRSWTRFFQRKQQQPTGGTTRPPRRQPVGIVYRQYGGNPECVGRDIVKFARECPKHLTAEAAMARYCKHLEGGLVEHFVEDHAAIQSRWDVEWTYDLECGEDKDICIDVIPGNGTVKPPYTSEWVVASGSADDIERWIKELVEVGRPMDFRVSTRTVTMDDY